jgi:hypothetical protein
MLTSDTLASELESLLAAFSSQYESLHVQTVAHREAIRKADGAAVQATAERQAVIAKELGTLDQRRRELVARACGQFPGLTGKPSVAITLTDLTTCVGGTQRGRLVTAAADLKKLISRVHEQTSTIKAATVSLVAHMEGLMRQVGRQLSHAGTYSNRGFVEPGGMVVSALDLST